MNDTQQIVIRDANFADQAAANVIHKSAYPNDRYCYANNIGITGIINLVAAVDNQMVGFISVLVNQPNPAGKNLWERMRPYIGFLGISEECRKFGIGTALIAAASRRALAATGASYIYLECEDTNELAQKLYEKTGFKVVAHGQIENDFGRPPHLNSRVYRSGSGLFAPS